VHHQLAKLRVRAPHAQVEAVHRSQHAHHGIGEIALRADRHRAAELRQRVLVNRGPGRRRTGTRRDRQGILRRHRLAASVAERRHALHPGQRARQGGQFCGAVDLERRQEPQAVVHREVRLAGRVGQQERPAVVQHLLDDRQLGAQLRKAATGHAPQPLVRRRRLAAQRGTVHVQLLIHGVGIGAAGEPHCRPEQVALRPGLDRGRKREQLRRHQRRRRLAPIQLARDAAGVAPDIGARLHHRDVAIAARERQQLRLGQVGRLRHRPPGQALQPEREADLFGEGREIVVVQDQFGHRRVPRALIRIVLQAIGTDAPVE
jgi:hypothetical protein